MKQPTWMVAVWAVLALAACGGGGGGDERPQTQPEQPTQPEQTLSFPLTPSGHYSLGPSISIADARYMPVYRDNRHLYVGVDQGTQHIGNLPAVGERGEIDIRHGRLNDGIGHEALAGFMSGATTGTVRRYEGIPDVRVIGASSARERRLVADAVQLVNAALPLRSKMSLGVPLPGFSLRSTVNVGGLYFVSDAERANTIHIEYLPCADYYGCGDSGGTTWSNWRGNTVTSTYIQMSHDTGAYRNDRWHVILLAHEILHALGLYQHPAPTFDTIMAGRIFDTERGIPQPLSLLYPIDREALQALYSLNNGDSPTSFGPWSRTSTHLAGNGPHANFGVALRNGYAEPWAHGVMPSTTLSGNRALNGSVTWAGALLGFTPLGYAVEGDAEIGVNLGTMAGRANFTNLDTWDSAAPPEPQVEGEAPASTWRDGDLSYTIAVRGNTFRETGGDAGRLTGIFTGRQHEGAAGTLERSDLTAAFGASR